MAERTYRTKKETIEYFKMLSESLAKEAHRSGNNAYMRGQAAAYEMAAFELEKNMR